MFKSGLNFAERNQVKEYVQECLNNDVDCDAEYVSKMMRVEPQVAENWLNHYLDELGASTAEDLDEYEDLPLDED